MGRLLLSLQVGRLLETFSAILTFSRIPMAAGVHVVAWECFVL